MSSKRTLYLVPKTLDEPIRILGLPADESIFGLFFAGFFFFLGKMFLMFLIPVAIILMMRMLKKGQSSSWILNVSHWYFPKVLMQFLLRKTPASENREYIA